VSVLDRKLRRDLAASRNTLLAIGLVIVVGIACFVGLASSYVNLERSRRAYYAQCRMADFSVELKKAPLSEIRRVADLPGVAEIQPRIVFEAVVDLEHVPKPISGRVISIPSEPRPIINNIVLRRGSWFTGERLEEVIVNDSFARARGVHPGQTIHIILNNRRQELFVVGTAISSEFVYLISPGGLIPEPESFGIFYVPQTFAAEALDFEGACNQVVGLLAPERRANPRPLLDAIERQLEPYGVFSTTPRSEQPSHRILTDELEQLRVTAVVLPGIFLLVATLILNILMTRLAEQQRTTVGTLKALGWTNAALTWHYLKFSLVVGILGGILGMVAGYWLGQGMAVIYRQYFELAVFENRVVPEVYGSSLAVGMVFALLGTLRGVRAVVALHPAEAMRPKPPALGGAVWLERFRGLWRRLGFRWQMVVRSIARAKVRTAAGIFAAAMGTTLLLVTFYFMDAFDYLIEFQFDKVLLSDIDLALESERDAGALLEARRLPGVLDAEPLFVLPCEFASGHRTKKAGITGVTAGAALTVPRDESGQPVTIPETGLVMGRKLAEILDLQVGAEVVVTPIRGRRDPMRLPVTRITDGYLGLSCYADYEYLNRIVNEEDAVSLIQLSTRSELAHRLALYRSIKQLPSVRGVSDNRQTKANLIHSLLDALRYSLATLIGLAGAIFFGSILTTSLISISERQREVATLLVIGYEKRQVGGLFLRESLLVNMTGAMVGLPLGLWLAVWLISVHSTELYRLPIVASPGSFVITMALALIFTLLAHVLVQAAINRLDWLDALNAKE
jgi:putative ABC transport system permease protein